MEAWSCNFTIPIFHARLFMTKGLCCAQWQNLTPSATKKLDANWKRQLCVSDQS